MAGTLLKCKWCDFRTTRFRQTKAGRLRHGGAIILSHVSEEHPAEYAALQRRLDEFDAVEGIEE